VTPASLEEALRSAVAQYLGADSEHLLALCRRDRGRLVGHDHVEILAELAGLPDGTPVVERLTVPYILLSTHYFVLDAIVDGHAEDHLDVLSTTPLLFLAMVLVGDELQALGPEDRRELLRRAGARIVENAGAVSIETERRRGWDPPNEVDVRAAVGRSNSTLLFYDLLCALAGHPPDPDVERVLSDLLHHLQMGDDLGDWRQDLRAGNHTMLLRECAARLGRPTPPDARALERELLIDGGYEAYVGRLVGNLDRIARELRALEHVRSERAQAYVSAARVALVRVLTDVVRTKLTHVSDVP
jgi:hypothetical protein